MPACRRHSVPVLVPATPTSFTLSAMVSSPPERYSLGYICCELDEVAAPRT